MRLKGICIKGDNIKWIWHSTSSSKSVTYLTAVLIHTPKPLVGFYIFRPDRCVNAAFEKTSKGEIIKIWFVSLRVHISLKLWEYIATHTENRKNIHPELPCTWAVLYGEQDLRSADACMESSPPPPPNKVKGEAFGFSAEILSWNSDRPVHIYNCKLWMFPPNRWQEFSATWGRKWGRFASGISTSKPNRWLADSTDHLFSPCHQGAKIICCKILIRMLNISGRIFPCTASFCTHEIIGVLALIAFAGSRCMYTWMLWKIYIYILYSANIIGNT